MLTETQQALVDDLIEIADEYGKFTWGIDGDGAHYAPAADNPFKAQGIVCRNCVFYSEESNSCTIVEGSIEPEAICKFWVIENEELSPEIDQPMDDEEEEEYAETEAEMGYSISAKYSGINFSPPAGVRSAAKRGLALHEKGLSGKGLESATVLWARKYTKGQSVSPARARMGNRFFGRNSRFANAPKDSPAWVSWLLWGGAAGRAWFARLVRQMDAADKKTSAAVKGSLSLSTAEQDNPFIRKIDLILTDFSPNNNKEAIPREEAENIIRTAVNTPLKINAFVSEFSSFYEGHQGASPIGAITSARLETIGDREVIKAEAYIWKQEFPGIYDMLKSQHASGTFTGTSWEVYYSSVEEVDGVRWLRGVTFAGTCIVDVPAYGDRTPILSVAEEKMEKIQQELEQALTLVEEQKQSITELQQQLEQYRQAEQAAKAEARREHVRQALSEIFSAAEVEEKLDAYVAFDDAILKVVLSDMALGAKKTQASEKQQPTETPPLPEPHSTDVRPKSIKTLAAELRQLKNSK
jgi:hypothetical protein